MEANRFTKPRKVWADSVCNGWIAEWVENLRRRNRIDLEIVKCPEDAKGFQAPAKPRVVERTFARLSFYRRMSEGCEYLPETGEALIQVAVIRLMFARLT
jgi:transposase